MSSYYPVCINLQGRRCIVIGGGPLAGQKVKGLLDAGAQVTVVAPALFGDLIELAAQGQIEHLARKYCLGDLAGAFLAICATHDPAATQPAWQEAGERNILINTIDDTPHSHFIVPSVLRQGDLVVAVSTSGKAPALAVRLRQQMAHELGPEYARFLQLAGAVRATVTAQYPDFAERKARWYRLVDSDVLELLRQGDEAAAYRRVAEVMGVAAERSAT